MRARRPRIGGDCARRCWTSKPGSASSDSATRLPRLLLRPLLPRLPLPSPPPRPQWPPCLSLRRASWPATPPPLSPVQAQLLRRFRRLLAATCCSTVPAPNSASTSRSSLPPLLLRRTRYHPALFVRHRPRRPLSLQHHSSTPRLETAPRAECFRRPPLPHRPPRNGNRCSTHLRQLSLRSRPLRAHLNRSRKQCRLQQQQYQQRRLPPSLSPSRRRPLQHRRNSRFLTSGKPRGRQWNTTPPVTRPRPWCLHKHSPNAILHPVLRSQPPRLSLLLRLRFCLLPPSSHPHSHPQPLLWPNPLPSPPRPHPRPTHRPDRVVSTLSRTRHSRWLPLLRSPSRSPLCRMILVLLLALLLPLQPQSLPLQLLLLPSPALRLHCRRWLPLLTAA